MIRTFVIAFRIRIAYRINTILYRIRSVLERTHVFPERIFAAHWLAQLVSVCAAIWEVVSAFLGKVVYFLVLYQITTNRFAGIPAHQQHS